ncbi:alpha-2-macroglobulin family protein [Hyphobacterium marinum]|uniref:Alpha-2-macroglobulin n=1 Tax=Hyphobacterium marinum TaxID=3116574 RepID=A0ABU7LVW8_9PROT|nr:alpha-2-macroglobulin [Hyphobacterium sp. Y6023]MEE2565703.1 alpha-2-macroglobulin [Hyphobacterium sp. Y6023]
MRRFHIFAGAMALFASVILAGCDNSGGGGEQAAGGDGGIALSSRSADAARAEPEVPDRFEYVRYRIDVTAAAPSVCLVFSQALDPDTDYDPYVRIEPDMPVSMSVSGQSLCIGGFDFGDAPAITLLEGFPAADGRTLPANVDAPFEFGDRPAYVGFSGTGVILPRVEADGIPIETVNVDTVDIRIRRITDRALAFRSISQGFTAGEGEYDWLYGEEDPDGVAVTVWEGEMDTPGPANAPSVTVFPLAETIGTLRAGAYFVEVSDHAVDEDSGRQPARAQRWFVITDLALTSYVGATGIDVTARSIQTAQAESDVRINLIARSNEVLASEVTDGDGHAGFHGPITQGEEAARPRLLLAYGEDGDFAVLDLDRSPLDLTDHDIAGRDAPRFADAYVYLDRGIYRPGETVHANTLIRDGAANAITDRSGTLVLYGPNGIEAQRARFDNAPQAGSVAHDFAISTAAARGIWRIEVELDGVGVIGRERFSVEDFVPQRIALDLEADDETAIRGGETRNVEASVRFLYGAPGAGLPVTGEARVQVDPSPFDGYEGYSFGRHDESFTDIAFDLPDTVADGAGNAVVVIDPENRGSDASEPLRIRAVISALEPGGRPVSDDVRIPYRPNPLYLGIRSQTEGRAERDETASFDIAAVDASGDAASAAVSWRLLRIDYRYDWYRDGDGPWRWRRSRQVVTIEDGILRVPEEGAVLETPRLDWGDYQLVLEDQNGNASASHGFWVGWGSQPEDGVEAPDRVRITTPDTAPAAGDTAQITILAPYAGQAELVVATDRVLETRTLSIPEGGARVSLPVTEDWGPGAYVMVSVYTPRDPVAQPRPRRAVGVSYISVDMDARTLGLTLGAPEIARPRGPVDITVTSDGPARDAYLTLAAVDEGILLLTNFQSPDPADYFFGQKRLDVDLYDDYGRLLDPNQGAAAPVRSGGDSIGGAGLSVVPTRTVALWSGPVRFDANGRAVIPLDIPDFNGELRLMAVAWSETALGAAAEPMTVRDEVPAELILPRFLAPGDTAFATATLDNVEGGGGSYSVDVTTEGTLNAPEGAFSVDLASGERADRAVRLTASAESISGIEIDVEGPDGFAVSHSYPIQVRSPYLPVSRIERRTLEPGAAFTPDPNLLDGFIDGSGAVQLTFSAIPMDAAALYESLSRYPYGCTEQQTSRAMPLLYADQMAALAGLESDAETRARIAMAVETLLNRQSLDGSFGQWRMGDRRADPWLGVYATDFLARAAEQGYAVPEAALERAYEVLVHVARQEMWRAGGYDTNIRRAPWQRDTQERLNERSSAYAMYVLARAGRVDASQLRYMHDQQMAGFESPLARAHVGAALALIGDRARASSAFEQAEAVLGYNNRGDYYQTARRDMAGVLALAAEAGEDALVERLAERVAEELPEPDRLTTQEKAFLLLAARALAGETDTVEVTLDGAASPLVAGRSFEMDGGDLAEGASFTNASDTRLWLTRVARGSPVNAPPPAADGASVTKSFFRTDGRPADLTAVTQGDRVVVAITLTGREVRRAPMIIADLLPAGFEIEAVLGPEEGGPDGIYAWLGELDVPNVAEARDDRFVAAIDIYNQEPVRLAYVVRAVTPGTFALPGAVAEDMYRPDVSARSAAGSVTIRPRS